MQKKKKKFGVIFFPPRKKGYFRAIFRDGQRSVTAAWATRSPWSISESDCARVMKKLCLDQRPGIHVECVQICQNGRRVLISYHT